MSQDSRCPLRVCSIVVAVLVGLVPDCIPIPGAPLSHAAFGGGRDRSSGLRYSLSSRNARRDALRQQRIEERRWRNSYGGEYVGSDYYPYYPGSNPVVSQSGWDAAYEESDGSIREEQVTEERHQSYYSPGRNVAVSRPRTTVNAYSPAPGHTRTIEQTSWRGADGKPHSTTVRRVTQSTPAGETFEQTHVTLKRAPAVAAPPGVEPAPSAAPLQSVGAQNDARQVVQPVAEASRTQADSGGDTDAQPGQETRSLPRESNAEASGLSE